jgi:predicted GNAT family acetyltransferase
MAETSAGTAVVERPERQRFEMAVEGELALAYYRPEEGRLVLTHTEVPQALSGRGVGSALASGVFAALRASGRKAVLRCDFMRAYAARHPEVQDVVVG